MSRFDTLFGRIKNSLQETMREIFLDLSTGNADRDLVAKSAIIQDLTVLDAVIYDDTFWTDLRVPLTQTKLGSNLKPDFDQTNVGLLFPQNDSSEIVYFITQMPHDWKLGTAIMPHIHWQQAANTDVTWTLEYKVINPGEAVPGSFTTVSGTTPLFSYVSGNISQITALGAGIDMTNTELSAIIQGRLFRDDNTTTGDVLGMEVDFHYEINTPGSKEPFTK